MPPMSERVRTFSRGSAERSRMLPRLSGPRWQPRKVKVSGAGFWISGNHSRASIDAERKKSWMSGSSTSRPLLTKAVAADGAIEAKPVPNRWARTMLSDNRSDRRQPRHERRHPDPLRRRRQDRCARIAGKNAIPRHQRRQLVLNHPDRREDGCHLKANCTSSGFESHSTGWEVSIWGIPTDTGMGR